MDLKETYNLIANGWAEAHWTKHYEWCDDYLNILAARVGKGGKILDIGCGSGEDSKFFADKGITMVGIDFSNKMIEEAKTRFPKGKFLVMDMQNMDFPSSSFDGVVAKHSLLHLRKKDLPTLLTKVNSLLKPGGWFLITLKEGIGEKEVTEIRVDKEITRFFAFYTNFEIRKLLEAAGFLVVEEALGKTTKDMALKFLVQKV